MSPIFRHTFWDEPTNIYFVWWYLSHCNLTLQSVDCFFQYTEGMLIWAHVSAFGFVSDAVTVIYVEQLSRTMPGRFFIYVFFLKAYSFRSYIKDFGPFWIDFVLLPLDAAFVRDYYLSIICSWQAFQRSIDLMWIYFGALYFAFFISVHMEWLALLLWLLRQLMRPENTDMYHYAKLGYTFLSSLILSVVVVHEVKVSCSSVFFFFLD